MFGTVARIKVKPGMGPTLHEVARSWGSEEYVRSGQVASLIFQLENSPDEYVIVAAFPDRETYFANAARPETDRNYRQMRELLVADPEWNDGEIVEILGIGGI
jgi:quinol monooxygenase YgiN